MVTEVGTTTMTSAQLLTGGYVLAENQLVALTNAASGAKWLSLYAENQTTLELSYTTGAAETSNYVEFYVEFGSGAPANIDWAAETMEYFDDVNNQILLEAYTYRLDGAAAGTEYTKRVQLPACTKGIRVYVKEVGVAANFGSITIKANTQAGGASNYNRSLQTVTTAAGSKMIITDGTDDAAVLARTLGTEQPAATDNALVVYDVGGGAASVSSEYRATTNGQDGTCVFASTSTLTLSGTSSTVNTEDLVYVKEVDTTGNTAAVFVNGAGGVHLEISGGTITKSGGSDFSANGVYELGYNGQDKAYNAPSDAEQNLRLNPDSETFIGETLATVVNEVSATNYYYMDMAGYRYFTLQAETSGATPVDVLTITVEATLQDDGTAAASCTTYQDVTNALFGVASWVDTDFMAIVDTPMAFKYVRVKTDTVGGNDDADYTLFAKRMF